MQLAAENVSEHFLSRIETLLRWLPNRTVIGAMSEFSRMEVSHP